MAGGVLPIARIGLLPFPGALGIPGVAEIMLILRPGQPGLLKLPFPCLATLGLEAITLARAAPVIGWKHLTAVQTLVTLFGRLHRFQNQKEPAPKSREK